MTYEDIRNPALPWGYWLHADGAAHGPPLVDGQGRRWNTVREAFWVDRLGMTASPFAEEQLERLTAYLAAVSRRVVHVEESAHDLFAGEQDFERFYRIWVDARGLTAGAGPFGSGISTEGHAALVMLVMTRPSQIRSIPVGSEAIAKLAPSKASIPEAAAWLDRVEAFAARLPFRFERRQLWRKPAVALVGDVLGDVMPLRRTLWMQTFLDHQTRDRFHTWLAYRLDRWEAWGSIAHVHGGPMLTQHFLAMMMISSDGSGRAKSPKSPLRL
jgi:hypothetical protein